MEVLRQDGSDSTQQVLLEHIALKRIVSCQLIVGALAISLSSFSSCLMLVWCRFLSRSEFDMETRCIESNILQLSLKHTSRENILWNAGRSDSPGT